MATSTHVLFCILTVTQIQDLQYLFCMNPELWKGGSHSKMNQDHQISSSSFHKRLDKIHNSESTFSNTIAKPSINPLVMHTKGSVGAPSLLVKDTKSSSGKFLCWSCKQLSPFINTTRMVCHLLDHTSHSFDFY